ncbi:hypothetical protein K438DRAFT_1765781 [Mycena galopus ATCC 62051]|nr:hypothetical protein K438DRAFT_1765781 [Mycena galopus ATCC 62051]
MFEEAADLSPGEIKTYRKFVFPDAIADPGHNPFFSVENAPRWVTLHGFQLYLTYDDSVITTSLWTPDNAAVTQLKAYRATNKILGEDYVTHPCFSLETPEAWINPQPFEAYMSIMHGPFEDYRGRRRDSTPFSFCAPSRAASSRARSRASSRVSFLPSSRASSPASFASSDAMSRPSSAMSIHSFTDVPELDPGFPDSDILPFVPAHIPETKALDGLHPKESTKSRGKGKGEANIGTISITRQQKVDKIVDTSTVESTWTVPRTPIAIRVDVSQCMEKLTLPDGQILSLDAFIRAETTQDDRHGWVAALGSLFDGPESIAEFTHAPPRNNELLFIDRSISEPDAHFNPELTFQYSTLDFSTNNGMIDVGMLGTTNSMDYPIDGAPNFDSTPLKNYLWIWCLGFRWGSIQHLGYDIRPASATSRTGLTRVEHDGGKGEQEAEGERT